MYSILSEGKHTQEGDTIVFPVFLDTGHVMLGQLAIEIPVVRSTAMTISELGLVRTHCTQENPCGYHYPQLAFPATSSLQVTGSPQAKDTTPDFACIIL